MTNRDTAELRLCLLITAAAMLAAGLMWRIESLAIAGGAVYLGEGLIGSFVLHSVLKQHRAGTLKLEEDVHPTDRLHSWIQGATAIVGLILLVVYKDDKTSNLALAGMLTWGWQVFFYVFLYAPIVRSGAQVPVDWTFYGWRVGHNPRRRR